MSRWFSKFWVSSNGYNGSESWFSSTEGMRMGEMIDLSSEIMRIKTGSRMLLSLGSTTGADIDSRIGLESLNWSSVHIHLQVQFQKMNNLPNIKDLILVKFRLVWWNWSLISKMTWLLSHMKIWWTLKVNHILN